MEDAFKHGLTKAATATNALIVTAGTNNGAAKLVGEAFSESLVDVSQRIFLLGIVSWGIIADREKLIVSIKIQKQSFIEILRQYALFYDKKTQTHNDVRCQEAANDLEEMFKQESLINIFQLEYDESDIEKAILKIFLTGLFYFVSTTV